MSSKKVIPLSPWMTKNADCIEKRYLRIGNSLILSDEFQKLSIQARYMFLCMGMESGGKREFTFPRTAQKKYGLSKNAYKWKNELVEHGFVKESNGKASCQKSVFEFSLAWKGITEGKTTN